MENIAGYILTGGQNRRMGGQKKLFLSLGNRTFLDRIKEAMDEFSVIYLSVEAKEPYVKTGLPMIEDEYLSIGPMGGIYSGLHQCREKSLFVAACDMPFVNRRVVKKICQMYEAERKTVVARTGDRIHPLLGVYTKEALPILYQMIQEEDYRMMNFLKRIDYTEVLLNEEEQALENINSQEDYGRLKEIKAV